MGRTMPTMSVNQATLDETALARAVDDEVERVLSIRPADEVDDGEAATREVLAGLDGHAAAASGPFGLPFVLLDGLEVTQEIQDLSHSVPLVAGKATIVRVYLRYAPAAVAVRGELRVARSPIGPWHRIPSLGPAQLDPSRAGGSLAQLRSRRADLGLSLNFRIPAGLTAAGLLWLRMGPVRRATGTPLASLAALPLRVVRFRTAVPLRLRLVKFRYTMGSPPVTHEPSATDIALIGSWLRRAYPIARLDVTITTVTAAPPAPFDATQINAQLIALRAVDVSTGTDARTHYYGMVADGGFFMRGRAAGIPQSAQPGVVASGPTGPSAFGWDTDGSYGDWMGGHELGHTLGRPHAEFCGAQGGAPYPFPNGQLCGPDEAFVGIDAGDPAVGIDMRVVNGLTTHDVMTYCDNQWLSSFTYSEAYNRLVAEDALAAGPAVVDALSGPGVADMRVIAALNITRKSGTITAVLPSALVNAEPAGDTDRYGVQLRIRAADGTLLDERPAAFQRTVCDDPDEDVTGVIDTTLPDASGAASIEVVVDGQVVDSHPIGGAAAIGELMAPPDAQAGPSAGGDLELRWEAPAALPAQRYIVQLSDDRGATWRTVAVALTEPAITIPRDDLAGDEVTVRILAVTGSGATVVRTETVTVR